ncbi:hypothetical protein [Pseudomonas sp.]|uniref:hypothetical protein n=1 Tax=Pseudomonas sp. TaxID=306 RepID=UPI002FC8AD06
MYAHALPALESELRTLQKYRAMVVRMLDEKSLNVEQRATLTFILDQLAQRRLIYAGIDPNDKNDCRGEDHGEPSTSQTEQ